MDPISAALTAVSTIVSRIWPDATEEKKAQLAAALQSQNSEFQLALAQINANQGAGAVHFRNGAGWVCVVSFAITALKAPIEWTCALAGHPVTLPPVDTSITIPMLLGLLGLGGMHAYERTK